MRRVTAPVRIDISGGWPDSDPYRRDYGGAVLNATINLRVSAELKAPNLVTSLENVPPSSGLGTSGALRACYLVASNNKLIENKASLIHKVHRFENEILEQRAGFQDEAAAIYGGVNYWEFSPEGNITRIPISKERTKYLENKLVLVYTGENHLSPNIHDNVFGTGNYEGNILKLNRMKEIAREMFQRVDDPDSMPELIRETWKLQRSLDDSIETDTMRMLQEELSGGYSACRTTGAGGGGCMIFYTDNKESLIKKMSKISEKFPRLRVIPFKFDYGGIRIE